MTETERRTIRITRLRLVSAKPGESLDALGRRVDNAWTLAETAVANGIVAGDPLSGGLIKVAVVEPFETSQ